MEKVSNTVNKPLEALTDATANKVIDARRILIKGGD